MEKVIEEKYIPEPQLTTGDIARYCHTTVMQVNRWIKTGDLKAFRFPGGQHRVTKKEFKIFLKSNGMPIIEEFFLGKGKKKILVADDDISVANAISYLLRTRFNFDVEVSRDGYETLIKAGDFKPDLLILDIRMPKIDGLEVCRRLRENKDVTPGIKILAITGHSEAYDRDTVLASGANDYLIKPFDKNALLDHVERLIE